MEWNTQVSRAAHDPFQSWKHTLCSNLTNVDTVKVPETGEAHMVWFSRHRSVFIHSRKSHCVCQALQKQLKSNVRSVKLRENILFLLHRTSLCWELLSVV